jgi:hypothetical protein
MLEFEVLGIVGEYVVAELGVFFSELEAIGANYKPEDARFSHRFTSYPRTRS